MLRIPRTAFSPSPKFVWEQLCSQSISTMDVILRQCHTPSDSPWWVLQECNIWHAASNQTISNKDPALTFWVCVFIFGLSLQEIGNGHNGTYHLIALDELYKMTPWNMQLLTKTCSNKELTLTICVYVCVLIVGLSLQRIGNGQTATYHLKPLDKLYKMASCDMPHLTKSYSNNNNNNPLGVYIGMGVCVVEMYVCMHVCVCVWVYMYGCMCVVSG